MLPGLKMEVTMNLTYGLNGDEPRARRMPRCLVVKCPYGRPRKSQGDNYKTDFRDTDFGAWKWMAMARNSV
jgi:hypothetical protein